MNDAYTGVVNWNGMLPENIDRIEVARGPFSSLYGGNAMGGVVNILTKMPQQRAINLQGGSGSDGYMTVYGSYGDKVLNRLSVFASYGYQGSNGYPTNPVVRSPTTPGTGTPVLSERSQRLLLRMLRRFSSVMPETTIGIRIQGSSNLPTI